MGCRPVLIERFTGTVLIDCAKAEMRLILPDGVAGIVARAPIADAAGSAADHGVRLEVERFKRFA